MTFKKSDLIDVLATSLPDFSHQDAHHSVQKMLDTIATALQSGKRCEIRGFGTFSLNYRKARIARNPKNGESVSVPEYYAIHFKPSKNLLSQINQDKPKST